MFVCACVCVRVCVYPSLSEPMFIRKDPDAGRDWGQKEKTATENEIVGWHHWLNRHELVQTPGDGGGWRGLVCCSPWGHKEWDTTWRLNNNKSTFIILLGAQGSLAWPSLTLKKQTSGLPSQTTLSFYSPWEWKDTWGPSGYWVFSPLPENHAVFLAE